MEQLSIFDSIAEEETQEVEEMVEEATEDSALQGTYTEEQREILSFLSGIITESLDPGCPIRIYRSPVNFYKVRYNDGFVKEKYTTLVSNKLKDAYESVEKALATQARAKKSEKAQIEEILWVDAESVPSDAKYIKRLYPLFSFTLDQSLAKPKWFSIQTRLKTTRISVVLSEKDLENNETFKRAIEGYKTSQEGIWCNIDIESVEHADVMKCLEKLKPILQNRFEFLHMHRIVEPCCCGLQYQCIKEKRCMIDKREMQMKCSFRKLMENKGDFVLAPKYK